MSLEEPDKLEVELVLQAIQSRYGYDFRNYSADSIARRLQLAAVKVGALHLGDLLHRLLRDVDVFTSVLDSLTVRFTELFRDPSFYLAFRSNVLPILRTYPQLKIWHAGCASGEEVYSTAILLSEEGLYDRSQIYATDISTVALEQAREGVYPAGTLPKSSEQYLCAGGKSDFAQYWSVGYGHIAAVESLRRNVHFFQHNLVSDYALGEMHVIICRNVLMYFNQELRERVFGMFAKGLYRGGFLCLGSNEALPTHQRGAYDELCPSERIFRHRSYGD